MIAPDHSSRRLDDLYSLTGRIALVTGAARGIGQSIAARLAEAGATVVIADINAALAAETAAELEAGGATATALALDVTDHLAVGIIVDQVHAAYDRIDILVNNAGLLGSSAPVTELDDDLFDRVMRVNVKGAINCSRAVAPVMIAAQSGVIVNIASTASYRVPNPGTLTYTTSKHALNAVTKVLAVELGQHGIRVLDIAPTMVDTPGIAELRAASAANSETAPKLGDPSAFAGLPLGRNAVPDDVARVVAFAVSDAAALMTGCTLAVDAGSMAVR